MATQEERIQYLIGRLQGRPQGIRSSLDALPTELTSSLPGSTAVVPEIQQGSFLDIASGAQMQRAAAPAAPVVPVTPPPPAPEPQTALDLFKAFDSPFTQPLIEPPSQLFEGTDDSLYAVPRGIARGALQTGLSMAEGLFAISDVITSELGYEDALDRDRDWETAVRAAL